MHARKWSLGALALWLVGFAQAASAQSTDGYHSVQVFPIVVDSGSFSQSFVFRATYPWDVTTIVARFYPAQGTAQPTFVDCPPFNLVATGHRRFASLRELCPGLAAGSAFGTLITRSGDPFAGYSRASSPTGIGFSVEAFPAHTFTSATTVVTGLRRLAAQVGSPAYQSNCFVGNLGELASTGTAVATQVLLTLSDPDGQKLGETMIAVLPGQLVRLLDVFAAAGVAAGDVDNALATFAAIGDSSAGLLTFCTVQDNTSFGADFRIGKQERAWGGTQIGPQDEGASRDTFNYTEEPIDEQVAGAPLAIPAGASRNVHLFYFRHPDQVGCWLWDDAQSNFITSPAYGLEIRLRVHDQDGWHVLGGGNDAVTFNVFLGDKPQRGHGANTSYQVEVESNGQNEGANRPYVLHCASGSGHNKGELLRKGLGTSF